MKPLCIALLALACAAAPLAHAQWQWKDNDGRRVFSDQPPPASVQEKDILKRPGARAAAPEAAAAASAPAAAAPAPAGSAPKLAGKDKDLEDKRKQSQAAQAEKKKAEDEADAKLRAESCDRAKRSKSLIDSGVRLSTTNAKGEREIMDDKARAAEMKILEGIISRDCKTA